MTNFASYSEAFPTYRLRETAQANQPRYVAAKRLSGVRLNWFIFGALFGVVMSFALNKGIESTISFTALAPTEKAEEVSLSALPALETIQTVETSAKTASEDAQIDAEKTNAAPAAPTYPRTIEHTIKSGETLANILIAESVEYAHAHKAIEALKKHYNPRNLRAGQKISFILNRADDGFILENLTITTSATESVELTRSAKGAFTAAKVKKKLSPELSFAGGTITSSLFEMGYANGIPDGVLAELVQAYSYDVDFQRQIQRGDAMEELFERMKTDDGDEVGYGDIIYATLKLRGTPISIYRYETKDGFAGFYNEKGESVVKALLKTPVNGARISSGFGKRRHPILGYNKMHKGTDFAAPTGTPIYAAGDATVSYVGRKGGYGNYIKLKHNGTYATAYAHLHRFAKGMRSGKKVKQGQVIGYVGSTGRSTGPHLHYEVHKNGKQVNPMREKFKTGKTLKGTELANFKQSLTKIKQQIASMPKTKTTLAQAQ